MGYDLDVYDRSSDGSHHRSYAYLVQAVRDLLARERLKLNRDRISKSNDMRYSTAASGEHSDSSIRKSPIVQEEVLEAQIGEVAYLESRKLVILHLESIYVNQKI